jgi:hypothetical protein
MAVYCTAAQLLNFADERTIRDLLSDSGQPVAGDLASNPKLTMLLQSASGRLEAACFVSENYTAVELAAMSDNSLALAAEICGMLVMATLHSRRPGRLAPELVKQLREGAEDYLQQLRNGARLFDVGDHAEAGKPSTEWPTVAEIEDLNAITRRTKHFYPDPARRLPISKGGG